MVLVEDIVDTGIILNYLLGHLRSKGPASVEVLYPSGQTRPQDRRGASSMLDLRSQTSFLWGMAWAKERSTAICLSWLP